MNNVTWSISPLPEGATIRRISLQPKRGYGSAIMLYNGKAIGKSEKPLYAAARWLLDNNAADPSDTVATYRGETLCMHGKVGELAQWTVTEAKDGKPSLSLHRWRAFEHRESGSPAALAPSEVQCVEGLKGAGGAKLAVAVTDSLDPAVPSPLSASSHEVNRQKPRDELP